MHSQLQSHKCRRVWGLFPTSQEMEQHPIPLKSLDILVDIIHNVAKVSYTQVYHNSSQALLETEFFFPISPDACFDSFEAKFNNTVVKGVIKEKQKAKEEYKEALDKKEVAAYSEINEETGDIMKVLIGNIPPNTDISITYSYIQKLEVEMNKFWCFRLFSTITPRYKGNWFDNLSRDIDILASYPTISSHNSKAYPWNIKIELQSPSPITLLKSPSHKIVTNFGNENHTCSVTLNPNTHDKPNKDFVLLFSNGKENMIDYVMTPFEDGYCAMVTMVADFKQGLSENEAYAKLAKPHVKQDEETPEMKMVKGEYIFLLDRSGSMKGDRIKMARSALQLFLKSLPSDSYFNVISFGNTYHHMHHSSVRYSKETLNFASQTVGQFEATMGGTQIYEPLLQIFNKPSIKGYPRSIFLLTDGAVANTQQVLRLITQNSDKTRVFTVGVGNGCSAELVTKSALYGKGKHEFVQDEKDIYEKVISLLDASLSPCYSDLSFHCENFDAVVQSVSPNPGTIPYLIDGQPFTAFLCLRKAAFENGSKMPLKLRLYDSQIDNYRTVEIVLDVENAFENEFLPKLAIHDMIKHMEEEKAGLGGDHLRHVLWMNKQEIQKALIELSVKYGILSKETAFICEIANNSDSDKSLPKIKTLIPTIVSQDQSSTIPATTSGLIRMVKCKAKVGGQSQMRFRCGNAMDSMNGPKLYGRPREEEERKVLYEKKGFSSQQETLSSIKSSAVRRPASSMISASSTATPRRQSELHEEKIKSYLDVLMKQNFEGFWTSKDQDLATFILKKKELPSMPQELKESDERVWMTILVLLWLEKVHSKEKKAWRLVHQKGCEWLRLHGVNYETVKSLGDTAIVVVN